MSGFVVVINIIIIIIINYYTSVVQFGIKSGIPLEGFCFAVALVVALLLIQDSFSYTRFIVFLYDVENYTFKVCEKLC